MIELSDLIQIIISIGLAFVLLGISLIIHTLIEIRREPLLK